uniref:Retrotransposon gag domain-containing protein n=1 Tax=Cajanus cajan TaxID=3821 RepID=A0A151UDG0_CAJCA
MGHLQSFVQSSNKRRYDSYPDERDQKREGNDRVPPRIRHRERNKRHLRAIRSLNAVTQAYLVPMPLITFTNRDFQGVDPVQDDPMVISVEINNCLVWKTLVNQGSLDDILYWKTFKQLGIPKQELTPYNEPLVRFSGERVDTQGTIDLYTYFENEQEGR